MDVLKNLNEKQKEAVLETEGYVRVIAGAGSGKTRVLVSRYAYLVQEYGIDSSNILCVTFTNKAAQEMKNRIRQLIGSHYSTTLICTYHGFCARLLRENPEKLFLTKEFQIIDTYQQKTLLEEIYQKYELKLDYATFEEILKLIAKVKSTTEYVPRFCLPAKQQIISKMETLEDEIIEEYMQKQKAIGALDFHDLLSFALYLLQTNQEIREKWQDRLNYIQVDEFQDSTKREMQLIDILSAKYKNLMIVGDPDQNIYEWRGSDVQLLVDFDKNHEGTKTIILNCNYRSTPQILKCANELIEKNIYRLKKDLYTLSNDGEEVIHYHSKTDAEETIYIVQNIKNLIKEGNYRYSDIAILYRSGFLSRNIENKLVENNIPYEIVGGYKFFQRMEVLDIIAYLKLIAFDDDSSFKRIINKPKRRFGRAKFNLLENLQNQYFLKENKTLSLFETLKEELEQDHFPNSDVKDVIYFIDKIRKNYATLKISEIVNQVCVETGYEKYIKELGDEERYQNLLEFKRIANEFENNYGENVSLSLFLEQLSLQSNEDPEKNVNTVKLMTIHSAKGLEFPVVFLVGLTEGIFPSFKSIEERKRLGLEEERRLCYVAITRAQKKLFILDSEGISPNGNKKTPSRFLNDIGTHNYKRIGIIEEDNQLKDKQTDDFLQQENEFLIGTEVYHHFFKKGKILSINKKKNSYLIQFDQFEQPRNISMNYFNQNKKQFVDENNKTIHDEPLKEDKFVFEKENENEIKMKQKDENITHKNEIQKPIKQTPIDLQNKEVQNEKQSENKNDIKKAKKKQDSFKINEIQEEVDNLWKRNDVPHQGWNCVGITDLGSAQGICQMCGKQIIRYVHHMVHPNYHPLNVGCICAGKMEGDIETAKKRENEFKNKEKRKENFLKLKWKTSRNGNSFLKNKKHHIVLYQSKDTYLWKYAMDGQFCNENYQTKQEAIEAAFEMLDSKI